MDKLKIIAAGGLVTNAKEELLMIFRRGKWDLPKGKLDEGESIEACAVREVEEETGLKKVKLKAFIGITYHEYFDDRFTQRDVIKESHWYAMTVKDNPELIPQTEEDIEMAEWCNEDKIKEYLQNSFPNIVEIVERWKKEVRSRESGEGS